MTENEPHVFLCHAKEDKPRVRELYHQLKEVGYHPWLDEEDLLPGQEWEYEIRRAIRNSNFILVCLSDRSIDKRGYVQKEIRIGLDELDQMPEGTIYLIPVRLEKCEVPEGLKSRHWVDLFEPDGFERLKAGLVSAHNVSAQSEVPIDKPSCAAQYFELGTHALIVGNFWEAKRCYEKTLAEDPYYPEAKRGLHDVEKLIAREEEERKVNYQYLPAAPPAPGKRKRCRALLAIGLVLLLIIATAAALALILPSEPKTITTTVEPEMNLDLPEFSSIITFLLTVMVVAIPSIVTLGIVFLVVWVVLKR